ncbi:MAG TPA: YcaO-like family protein [Desulfobacterales bacterium]
MEKPVQYHLELVQTEAATGYFTCRPTAQPDFDTALTYARRHPNDEFMRRHLLRLLNRWDAAELVHRIRKLDDADDFLAALYADAGLLNPELHLLLDDFEDDRIHQLSRHSPLVFLKSISLDDHELHRQWNRLFRENLQRHHPLPAPQQIELEPPFPEASIANALEVTVTLAEVIRRRPCTKKLIAGDFPADAVAALALERLQRAGIGLGPEMRHEASLSPVALLRKWQVEVTVQQGRHDYRLTGEQTAYGRGLDLDTARAACLMEIVERRSAFAGIDKDGLVGYAARHTLIRGRASELAAAKRPCLDPNRLNLEVPYQDEAIWWIDGEQSSPDGPRTIYVPAQMVFLFCNLDEPRLFSALGSTGLAAGTSPEQARVSALLEVIERDSLSVVPFAPQLCFDIESHEPRIAALLAGYAVQGIGLQFQDITAELGVPCCKCFVVGEDGCIYTGTGAHLDARRALVAALTETPYPFPGGPASQPPMRDILRVPLENLPDYTCGNPADDLKNMETLLCANGRTPVYVDLTRTDVGLPVVRALVPGMELLGDFDRFARVTPRMLAYRRKLTRT